MKTLEYTKESEVSPTTAAKFLNLSRGDMINLLKNGAIPFHQIGRKRLVLMEDLIRYQSAYEITRNRGLDELVLEGQILGM